MKLINGVLDPLKENIVATIGYFDGVHCGHRFLIKQLKQKALELGLPSAIITFRQHPRKVLHSNYQPLLINSFEERIEQIATTGVDYCIVLDFTLELAALNAAEFIQKILAQQLHISHLLIGYDHRFGKDRAEGFEQYVMYGAQCGIEVIKALPFFPGEEEVSSSLIRKALLSGQVEDAEKWLTYPYNITGKVVNGERIGRTLGFPTANIDLDDPDKIIPMIGVYAVEVKTLEKKYPGMLYIGHKPTLEEEKGLVIEVHIIGINEDLYNSSITVFFKKLIRKDQKFDSLEDLRVQLTKDKKEVELLFSKI